MTNTKTIYKGYYANELHKMYNEIATAREGEFYNGYTVMPLNDLVEGVEGRDALLDANLKALVPYKEDIEAGHTVNVHLEWTLSDDRRSYTYAKVLGVTVEEN